jgi:hypothetical protein
VIVTYDVPDGFWGLTIDQVRAVIKKVNGAKLTNKTYTLNNGLHIEGIGPWELKAHSQKALNRALFEIQKKVNPVQEKGKSVFG